jgi:membrane fusion protein, multidrug efflux system
MENSEQARAPGTAAAENGSNGKKTIVIAIVALVVFGVIFGTKWFMHRLAYTTTDDAQVSADLLPISFKVPGRIEKLLVSEGDRVRSGQALAELDVTDYRLALDQARARLDSARNEFEKAESSLSLTKASARVGVLTSASSLDQVGGSVSISTTQQAVNSEQLRKTVERAEINQKRAQESYNDASAQQQQSERDRDRAEELYRGGVISEDDVEKARTNADSMKARLAAADQNRNDAGKQLDVARANLRQAEIDGARTSMAEQDRTKAGLAFGLSKDQQRQQVKIAEATLESLRAQVKSAEVSVEQAEVALRETRIVSPVDGIIAKKTSQPFEIVAAGKPVFFIVDSGTIHVDANLEEGNIHKIRAGGAASITVDALPGKVFKGTVETIGATANSVFDLIPSGNTSGQFIKTTQRVPVKIHIEGSVPALKPGTNVIVSIKNTK